MTLSAILSVSVALAMAAGPAAAEERPLNLRPHQPFEAAHQALMATGWHRRPTHVLVEIAPGTLSLGRLAGLARAFYFAGYAEVETCDNAGVPRCTFNYLGADGRCLRLLTIGASVTDATIASWSFECPPDGAVEWARRP